MRGPRPLRYSTGAAMAAPLPPLDRDHVNAELTKLLQHGFGSLTIKVYDRRITALDTTMRYFRVRRAAEAEVEVEKT